jgi:3-phosphoglycerate kinase
MKDTEIKTRFVILRGAGNSLRKCAKELGISHGTAETWEKRLQFEIKEARRYEFQQLFEAYNVMKQARIRVLGETLRKVQEAMEAVDFSQLPPDKLLDLQLKYISALKAESEGMDVDTPPSTFQKELDKAEFILENGGAGCLEMDDFDKVEPLGLDKPGA